MNFCLTYWCDSVFEEKDNSKRLNNKNIARFYFQIEHSQNISDVLMIKKFPSQFSKRQKCNF
ncbi:hypothetical protein T10_13680 [Trichinella papuae]|uniref:Uncharacterized protein n=1 Tax=Trichinella papuae TaxID=268474 RepID=A0A0V1M180_9BILA|nr:hypothetical protein T10_4450 [Trichinella papuae]KRZ65436.1 hypothetical protein T10_13680 [Trichinella papuae]